MHNNKALISIIVPVYKVEQYLSRCVDSILAQTFTDFECILVDDGSPDNCPQMCDEYAKKDARIKVIHKENGGLSDARNFGTNASVGEYITFIDSDDFIAPNYIEYLYSLLQKHNADISACGHVYTYNNEAIYGIDKRFPQEQIFAGKEVCANLLEELRIPLVTAWGKLYKAEIVKKYLFPFGKKHEDDATTCKFYYSADTVVLGNQQLYAYFINQFGIMRTINPKEVNVDAIWALNHQAEFFMENNELALAQMSWDYLFYYMVRDSKNNGKRCDEYIKKFASNKHLPTRVKLKSRLYACSPWIYHRYVNMRKGLEKLLLKLRKK